MDKPSSEERWIVWKCLMDNGLLIGSLDEVWTHRNAWLLLTTLRECMDAISLIVGAGIAVHSETIKSCVMQSDGMDTAPFGLSYMAEFLYEDNRARTYWQSMTPDDKFPHKCPYCKSAAFIGFNMVDCKAKCK